MRVLLIQPAVSDSLGFRRIAQLEPLGLEYVAASLKEEHTVEIFDARFESDLPDKLARFKADAVGVGVPFTADVNSARRVIATVRSIDQHCRVFVGGHHASMAPDDLANEVDAVVIGDGEVGTTQLLASWARGDTSVTRVGSLACPPSPITTQPTCMSINQIEDLDLTPMPARSLTRRLWLKYHFGSWQPCALVETSRGCPHQCRFCAVWKLHNKTVRARSTERVMADLNKVWAPNVVVADDNLFANIERAKELAFAVARSWIRKSFLIQVRTDAIVKHPDLVDMWVRVGLKVAFVGYESFTQEQLDNLNKHNSVEANEAALKILRQHQVQVIASIIVDPNFGREDFAALADYVRRQGLVSPIFTVLTPLPGTDLYEEWQEKLADTDYELFDLQHALLPTRLDLPEFYRQYSRLYLSTYLAPKTILRLLSSGSPLNTFQALWQARRALNPTNLLAAHKRRPVASLSQ